MLKTGDKAPLDVELIDTSGNKVKLSDYSDKYIVLYFYPKDDTPGCTVEACGFRDSNVDIEKLGAKVIGVSGDDTKSHNKFIKKFGLNFTLLTDEDHKLQDEFGVWGEKSMFGKTFMGTIRTTFIISPQGKIVKAWEKVEAEGHNKEVLDSLKELIS